MPTYGFDCPWAIAKAQESQGAEIFESGLCYLSQTNKDYEGREATLIGSGQRRLTSEANGGIIPLQTAGLS